MKLSRGFMLARTGSCSLCNQDRADVRALIGTADGAERICDECIELCGRIVSDETKTPTRARMSAEEFQRDVADVLESVVKTKTIPEMPRPPITRRVDSSVDISRCTFCGAHRKDVVKLINSSSASICDVCVDEATAVIAHVLHA